MHAPSLSRSLPVALLALILLAGQSTRAQIPRTLSYQGVLADTAGLPKPDGDYSFTFRMYASSAGGPPIWSEAKTLHTKRGLFSTILGNITPIPDSVRFDQQYWLGVQVAPDPELSPRMQLASAGSSLNSVRADLAQTVPDNSITAGKIAGGQVVKSINNLHDNLTMRGANGAAVTTNGDTITVTASGGSGGGISAIQNTDNTLSISNPGGPTATINVHSPFVINSSMGIGGATPNHRLRISGGPAWTSNGWLGELEFDNASAMAWRANAAGTRFGLGQSTGGLFFFRTASDPGTTGSPAVYDMVISDAGKIGLGTLTPAVKLDVQSTGGDIFHLTGLSPFMTFYDSNHGNKRSAIQEVNGGLNLFTDSYLTGTNLFGFTRLDDNGNFGIGSATPTAKLEVASTTGDIFHLIGSEPFMTFYDSNHGYARGAIQQVNGGINMFTNSYLTGTNLFGFTRLDDNGNFGIGSATPTAKLEVASGIGDIFHLIGYEPYMTFYDSNHGYARGAIQQVNGGLNMFTNSYLTGANLTACIRLADNGNLGIGTLNPSAKLEVLGHTKTQVLEITGGSDLAEPFDMDTDAEPGTVVVIDSENPGALRCSDGAYDRRVAGIVSGAGGVHPGLTLRQEGVLDGTHSVAIAGRVYCKAEALTNPIQPGDLLTTSGVKGYAMKATDRDKSQGAIIGKAMSSLGGGKGLVLVLVNLQ
jgi:hypothetical protein